MDRVLSHLLAVAALSVGLVSCSDDTACARDSDCYADERCVEGECSVSVSNNGNAANASNSVNSSNGSNSANSSNSTNNVNSVNSTNNVNSANSTNNVNATNNTNNANSTNNTSDAACVVDVFDTCTDPFETDSNDSWFDADSPGSSGGCVTDRDTIIPREWTVEGKRCHLEPGDWYGQTVVPCDTKTLIARVRVTPKTMCMGDLWELEFNRAGASIPCSDARIQCSIDGEDKVIQWLVEPASSVESYYFGVTSTRNDVDLEYDLTFTIM